MKPPQIIIDREVSKLGVVAAGFKCIGVIPEKHRPDIYSDLQHLVSETLSRHELAKLKNLPKVKAYRKFMWQIGIDPTKTRLSSEALIRRILRKKSLPSINSIVDSCNMASIETLIPISAFDAERVNKEILIQKSLPGEVFVDIHGKEKHLKGDEILVTDSLNNKLHLLLFRDSNYAKITYTTRGVLGLAYGVPDIPVIEVTKTAEAFRNYLLRYYPNAICTEVIVSP